MPIERTVSTIDVALSVCLAPAWHKTYECCPVIGSRFRPAGFVACDIRRLDQLVAACTCVTKFIGINSSTNNPWQMHYFTTHEWMRSVTSVSLSACVCPVRALTFESLDPETRPASRFLYGISITFFGEYSAGCIIHGGFAASTFRPIFDWISATQAVNISCSNRILL